MSLRKLLAIQHSSRIPEAAIETFLEEKAYFGLRRRVFFPMEPRGAMPHRIVDDITFSSSNQLFQKHLSVQTQKKRPTNGQMKVVLWNWMIAVGTEWLKWLKFWKATWLHYTLSRRSGEVSRMTCKCRFLGHALRLTMKCWVIFKNSYQIFFTKKRL